MIIYADIKSSEDESSVLLKPTKEMINLDLDSACLA